LSQIPLTPFIPQPGGYTEWRGWASDFYRAISEELMAMKIVFAERLTFGDATANDNIAGRWLKDQSTHATPDTEVIYDHNLGVVPVGILVVKQDKAGVIYAGSTAWTTTQISLKCSVASTTFTAFLLAPPTEIV